MSISARRVRFASMTRTDTELLLDPDPTKLAHARNFFLQIEYTPSLTHAARACYDSLAQLRTLDDAMMCPLLTTSQKASLRKTSETVIATNACHHWSTTLPDQFKELPWHILDFFLTPDKKCTLVSIRDVGLEQAFAGPIMRTERCQWP